MRFLVTAGATRESIDAVRFLTNLSTGSTGALLASELVRLGHEVLHLRGEGAAQAPGLESARFGGFASLDSSLRGLLSGGVFDACVHCAAVGDYSIADVVCAGVPRAAPLAGKLPSGGEISLQLRPNPKILPRLKGYSPRPLFVAGFKLTSRADERARAEAVRSLFLAGGVDLVAHNDASDLAEPGRQPFLVYSSAGEPAACAGAVELARLIEREALGWAGGCA
jgi:phosphopantothenoylcysteine decarboxylase/phosphopantothenate--cysteine ligase